MDTLAALKLAEELRVQALMFSSVNLESSILDVIAETIERLAVIVPALEDEVNRRGIELENALAHNG